MRATALWFLGLALLLGVLPPASAQDRRRGAPSEAPSAVLPDIKVLGLRVWPPPGTREEIVLPPYGSPGMSHPMRRAAFNVGWAFGLRSNLAGNPAAAAQALKEMSS